MSEILDNDITLSYKKAYELKTSIKYIYLENGKYVSCLDIISQYDDLLTGYNFINTKINISSPTLYSYLYILSKNEEISDTFYSDVNTFLQLFNIKSTFLDSDDLFNSYVLWFDNTYSVECKITEKICKNIGKIQGDLIKQTPLEWNDYEITTVNKIISVSFKNITNLELEDGVTIFNDAIVSKNVPFIQYNSDNEKFFKIFENNEYHEFYNDFKLAALNNNYIYIALCLNKKERVNKNSFTLLTISLLEKTLKIKVEIDLYETAKEYIQNTFPNLILGKVENNKIKGFFTVNEVIISKPIIHFLIVNEKMFNNYLYIEESEKSVCEKKILTIHYKSFTGTKTESKKSSVVISFDVASESIVQDKSDLMNVRINVIKAESEVVLKQFIQIFTRLLGYYMANIFKYSSFFNEHIGDILPVEKGIVENNTVSDLKTRKIGQSKIIAPEYFGQERYARYGCKCGNQPIIIDDDEVEEWRQYQINVHGEYVDRVIKKIPKSLKDLLSGIESKNNVNLVCPRNSVPYPTLKVKNLEDRIDVYPCCSNTEDKEDISYKIEMAMNKGEVKSSYVISTLKILTKEGEYGYVPTSFHDLLSSGINIETYISKNTFLRERIPQTKSSLLHCLLIAIEDLEYISNQNNRENICQNVRQDIVSQTNLNVVMQEMYDSNIKDISENIKNENVFLDPKSYYRALEEYFDINIFVFTCTGNDVDVEIPRCKDICIRLKRIDRKSVIILKHENLNHCELMFYKEDGKTYLFDDNMTDYLYNVFYDKQQNFVFTNYKLHKNPFIVVDYKDIFRDTEEYKIHLESQFIDKNGKTYGLNINIDGFMFTVFIPFTQPLELKQSNQIYKNDKNKIELYFGESSKISNSGSWYNLLDLEKGIFVVGENFKAKEDKPFIPEFNKIDLSYVRLKDVKKCTSILMQLINWLWKLSIKENKVLMPIQTWWEKYVIKDNNMKKNVVFCDDVPYILPDSISTDDGLKKLSYKPYFTSNKIKLYPELYDVTYSFFKKEYLSIVDMDLRNFYMSIPKRLSSLFVCDDDFTKRKENIVIVGGKKFDEWVYYAKNVKDINTLYTTLTVDLYKEDEPMLFKDINTGKIYIIQNVHLGNINRALYVAEYWDKYNVNVGKALEWNEPIEDLSYIVYGISVENKIVPIDDQVFEGDEYFVQLLKYSKDSDVYAAMLEIL